MKTYNLLKPLALMFAAAIILSACADKDAIVPAGMVASKDGTPIRYQSQGEGKTAIVLVHCWTCDHSFWNAQYDALAANYKVVRLDLAGHGGSAPRKTYNMKSYGDDVVAVANALKLQRMILVGHSMGGPVSVEAEKQLGDRVVGVVGVDTFYTPFVFPTEEEAITNFVKPFEEDFATARAGLMNSMFASSASAELVSKVAAPIPEHAHDMGVQSMYDIFRWSARERPGVLDALGNRLRNINGDPEGKAEKLHDSVTLIAGAAHFPHMEKPVAFNKALLALVKELDM